MMVLESMEEFNKLVLNKKMDGQKFKIAGVEYTLLVFHDIGVPTPHYALSGGIV